MCCFHFVDKKKGFAINFLQLCTNNFLYVYTRCAINFLKFPMIVPMGWSDVAFNELLFHLRIAFLLIFILISLIAIHIKINKSPFMSNRMPNGKGIASFNLEEIYNNLQRYLLSNENRVHIFHTMHIVQFYWIFYTRSNLRFDVCIITHRNALHIASHRIESKT